MGGVESSELWYVGQLYTINNTRHNWIDKDDRMMALPRGTSKYWTDSKGQEFELLAIWNPNEEPDPWARYRDILEDREYTCRFEAFQTRFQPRPD
jgi:hypothetical protein